MRWVRYTTALLLAACTGSSLWAQTDSVVTTLLAGRWQMQAMGEFEAALHQADSVLQQADLNANQRKALDWDIRHLKSKYKIILDSSYLALMPDDSFESYITPDSYHELEIHRGKWQLNTNNPKEINLAMKGYTLSLYIDTIAPGFILLQTDPKDPRKYWKMTKP